MSLFLDTRLTIFQKTLLAADRIATRLGQPDRLADHLRTGIQGEEAAFFFLRRHGYIVTARRWRAAPLPGDIDLVGWDNDALCFIEVKTRSSHAVASAEAAVDEHKHKTLRRLAQAYIRQLPHGSRNTASPEARFDILSIYMKEKTAAEYQLFRGAFGWS
jgi:putative endonuclease